MNRIPDIVTHNYDPDRGAFRNICDLSHGEAERILRGITASGKRSVKPDYLARRHATERWLLGERTRKLGAPRLPRPIYFFLGDFADGRDPSRPRSIRIPLAAFPFETITFTYPDSMASLPLATRADHDAHRRAYHGQIFTLDEIEAVVADFGMPGARWKTEPSMKYDRFIEAQVWDDRPIRQFLKRAQIDIAPDRPPSV